MTERLFSAVEFEGGQAIADTLRAIGKEYGFDAEAYDKVQALSFEEVLK